MTYAIAYSSKTGNTELPAKTIQSNRVIGTFLCQGKMPMTVWERYESMMASEHPPKNIKAMIGNFDATFSHPDVEDLERLRGLSRDLLEE